MERFRRVGMGAEQGNHDKVTTQTTLNDPVLPLVFSSGRGVWVRSSEQVPYCAVFPPRSLTPYPVFLSLSLCLLLASLHPASGHSIPASFLPACRRYRLVLGIPNYLLATIV